MPASPGLAEEPFAPRSAQRPQANGPDYPRSRAALVGPAFLRGKSVSGGKRGGSDSSMPCPFPMAPRRGRQAPENSDLSN